MKKTGFTLIEMMLVVVIIGIIAGTMISVINIPRIQARSRDSRRIGDLKSIQTALELYFSNYRAYPDSSSWASPENILTSDYMSSVPLDPKEGETPLVMCFGDGTTYGYYYKSLTGGKYILGATMELDTNTEGNRCIQTDVVNCDPVLNYGCNSSPQCYCVQNPL